VKTLQPDILLLDVEMPTTGGLELLGKIRGKSPKTKICLLADCFEEDIIIGALQRGAQGYLLKTAAPTELIKAIHTTHAGELWAPRKLLTQVLENLRRTVNELQGTPSQIQETLTDREQEVVTWAVQGLTNKEIAARLGVSETTVKTHLQNIFRKLKVRRRVQLTAHSPHLASHPPAVAAAPLRRDRRA
jgi:DNA-binding NarL/FixJ family response regulator